MLSAADTSRFGTSTDGVALVSIDFSDPHHHSSVPKAEVKLVGNVHGDEPSGRQLLLQLAEHICHGYRTNDSTVLQLLAFVKLSIIPTLNPDGFEMHHRGNRRNVDLNRDFPDPQKHVGKHDLRLPTGHEQPETLAMMNFTLSRNFVASLAIHEGALVANYPWDGYADGDLNIRHTKHTCPDNAAFVLLATAYAKKHTTMAVNNKEFPSGITNGAEWYPLYGGLQDWNYVAAGCMEVTLELNDQKWPQPARLAEMWRENKQALLEWPLMAATCGLRGRVLGYGPDGLLQPLAANITVDGIATFVRSTPSHGGYTKILAPGTYTVHASAKGFKTNTAQLAIPQSGAGLVHDFMLNPVVPWPPTPPSPAQPPPHTNNSAQDHHARHTPPLPLARVSTQQASSLGEAVWISIPGVASLKEAHHSWMSSRLGFLALILLQLLLLALCLAWRRRQAAINAASEAIATKMQMPPLSSRPLHGPTGTASVEHLLSRTARH
ncbi:hypothetical protein QJQ45_001970 [Haematococcus lacustris]|nr:hypothetical protein QJQ45_001970 [Haematococcus lacustris]